jgi:hypothetical protein
MTKKNNLSLEILLHQQAKKLGLKDTVSSPTGEI